MGHVWPCERPLNSLGLEGKNLAVHLGKRNTIKKKTYQGRLLETVIRHVGE